MIDRLKELHAQGADVVGTSVNTRYRLVGLATGGILGYGLSKELNIDNASISILGAASFAYIGDVASRVARGIEKEPSN